MELRERVRAVLRRHWVDVAPGGGYTAPSRQRYPWQWLWDSCFHALIWAELGDDRGLDELAQALGAADVSGCLPHMVYQLNPRHHEDLWGRQGASSITGPPMYGHALAELHRRGAHVPERLLAAAADGLEFLLRRRERHAESGLVLLCHPWESGADNDPALGRLLRGRLRRAALVRSQGGTAGRHRAQRRRRPAGQPALRRRLGGVLGSRGLQRLGPGRRHGRHRGRRRPPAGRRGAARWDGDLCSYTDAGDTEAGSGRVRTAYGLLGLLTETDPGRAAAIAAELGDPRAYGGAYGLAGVHRAEPSFAARAYWRGPSWPQLDYLLWVGLRRAGLDDAAQTVAVATVAGAEASGLAEYWDSDDGTGLGAVPRVGPAGAAHGLSSESRKRRRLAGGTAARIRLGRVAPAALSRRGSDPCGCGWTPAHRGG